MHIAGITFGGTLDATKAFQDFFISGNLRLAYGSHDYKGADVDINSGSSIAASHSGEDDLLFEARVLAGHDFIFDGSFNGAVDLALSPYAGLGFRYLDNDGTGNDSNGVAGYERYSHYFYLPIGLTPRIRVNENSRVSPQFGI